MVFKVFGLSEWVLQCFQSWIPLNLLEHNHFLLNPVLKVLQTIQADRLFCIFQAGWHMSFKIPVGHIRSSLLFFHCTLSVSFSGVADLMKTLPVIQYQNEWQPKPLLSLERNSTLNWLGSKNMTFQTVLTSSFRCFSSYCHPAKEARAWPARRTRKALDWISFVEQKRN